MGMPLDQSFIVFDVLSRPATRESWEFREVARMIEPFRLFAFILHDPEAHPSLDKHIQEYFEWYDGGTGNRLLFFSIVRPSDSWLQQARTRPYFAELRRMERVYPKMSPYAFAARLNIPEDELPCLVVVPDLTGLPHAVSFRTCPDHLGDQLRELRKVAETGSGPLTEAWRKGWRAVLPVELTRFGGLSSTYHNRKGPHATYT